MKTYITPNIRSRKVYPKCTLLAGTTVSASIVEEPTNVQLSKGSSDFDDEE